MAELLAFRVSLNKSLNCNLKLQDRITIKERCSGKERESLLKLIFLPCSWLMRCSFKACEKVLKQR